MKILTHRGLKDPKDVNILDRLHSCTSNSWVMIKDLVVEEKPAFDVVYNDGRIERMSTVEFGWSTTVPPTNAFNKSLGLTQKFKPGEVDFKTGITEPPRPDPYTAGGLLTYGNRSIEYLNTPVNRYELNSMLAYKYGMEVYETTKDYAFYQWKNVDRKVTWNEFFYRYDLDKYIIPREYMYGNIEDRKQFLRGVFDMGYNKSVTPDVVSVIIDEQRVKLIQWMLWSLGIPSMVVGYNEDFMLEVIGCKEDYPGFFYDHDYIANMASKDDTTWKYNPPFRLGVDKIVFVPNALVYEVYTGIKYEMFYSDKFLPRFSLG